MSQNKKMVEAITPINEDFTQWYTDIFYARAHRAPACQGRRMAHRGA